jgi:pimeloyl-ACP methyl ester carboxylesterase
VTLRFEDLFPATGSLPKLPAFEYYTARDGTPLPFRHYPGGAPLDLLLLHGSSSHSVYLAGFAAALAAAGAANVYTPDLRGHGLAPQRRGDIDYIDQLEDDLADFIAQRRAAGAKKIVLAGHSSGGGLALRFGGGRHGTSADAFLLLAPYLGYDAPTVRKGSGGWAQASLGKILGLLLLNACGITRFNATQVLRFNLPQQYRTGVETLSYSYRMMTGFNPRNFGDELAAIRQPLRVLVGAADEAFVAGAFAPAIQPQAPQALVTQVEGVSHLGLVASSAARTLSIEWLRGLTRT